MKKKILIVLVCALAIIATLCTVFKADNEITEAIETIQNSVINEIYNIDINVVENTSATTEIPEAYLEDEEKLEHQETEAEGFELQGEIAYNGSGELPQIQVGAYTGLTYYSQIDPRWKNLPYTSTGNLSQTMGSSSCGPTCAAMVVSSIKGNILPTTMADLYVQYGFRSASNGTYWSAFRWTADVFNIGYKETVYLDEACKLLEDNYYLIVACGNGLFTTGGHFIMLYDYDGTYIKVYDPYLYSGKFNTSTRRGKTIVDGNTVLVTKDNFRAYANYGTFFAFKNDRTDIKENTSTVSTATYTRYVRVNTSLNVRSGPGTNYNYIRSLYNNAQITVYEENGNWSRIGDNEWVCSDYLSDSNIVLKNTVGEYRKLKNTTILYSNSNLTGTTYTYLKNTRIQILKNINSTIDYIYIKATNRYAYVSTEAYENNTVINTAKQYRYFKNNTIIYSNSNLSGIKYYYLPNTKVEVVENISNTVDKIYVPATDRTGYVSRNVYK